MATIYVTSGGSGGATLTINTVASATVELSKDGKTKTKTADSDGIALFKGLEQGKWMVKIINGSQVSVETPVIINTDYPLTMAFFSATITVTFPTGSTCTCTKGSTTLNATTAEIAAGQAVFTVPEAGDWVVTCNDATSGKSATKSVENVVDGGTYNVTLAYGFWLYKRGWEIGTPALTLNHASKQTDYIACSIFHDNYYGTWSQGDAQISYDLTPYTKFNAILKPVTNISHNTLKLYVSMANNVNAALSAREKTEELWNNVQLNDEITLSLDISTVNTTRVIAAGVYGNASATAHVLEMWLE